MANDTTQDSEAKRREAREALEAFLDGAEGGVPMAGDDPGRVEPTDWYETPESRRAVVGDRLDTLERSDPIEVRKADTDALQPVPWKRGSEQGTESETEIGVGTQGNREEETERAKSETAQTRHEPGVTDEQDRDVADKQPPATSLELVPDEDDNAGHSAFDPNPDAESAWGGVADTEAGAGHANETEDGEESLPTFDPGRNTDTEGEDTGWAPQGHATSASDRGRRTGTDGEDTPWAPEPHGASAPVLGSEENERAIDTGDKEDTLGEAWSPGAPQDTETLTGVPTDTARRRTLQSSPESVERLADSGELLLGEEPTSDDIGGWNPETPPEEWPDKHDEEGGDNHREPTTKAVDAEEIATQRTPEAETARRIDDPPEYRIEGAQAYELGLEDRREEKTTPAGATHDGDGKPLAVGIEENDTGAQEPAVEPAVPPAHAAMGEDDQMLAPEAGLVVADRLVLNRRRGHRLYRDEERPAQALERWAHELLAISPEAALAARTCALMEHFETWLVAGAALHGRDRSDPHWAHLLFDLLILDAGEELREWITSGGSAEIFEDPDTEAERLALFDWTTRSAEGSEGKRMRARLLSELARFYRLDMDGGSDTLRQGSVEATAWSWMMSREPAMRRAIDALGHLAGVQWTIPATVRSLRIPISGEPQGEDKIAGEIIWMARASGPLCERAAKERRAREMRAHAMGEAPGRQGRIGDAERRGASLAIIAPKEVDVSEAHNRDTRIAWRMHAGSTQRVGSAEAIAAEMPEWAEQLDCAACALWVMMPQNGARVSEIANGVWISCADADPQETCQALCRALAIDGLEEALWAHWSE